jgi:hypothetical protein
MAHFPLFIRAGPRTLKKGLRQHARRANRFLIARKGALDSSCSTATSERSAH